MFDVVVSALINSSDATMQFLLYNPIDALLAVEVSHKEYLLVFTSMLLILFSLLTKCFTVVYISIALFITILRNEYMQILLQDDNV